MKTLRKINRVLAIVGAAMTVAMMVIVVYDVFCRYVLNDPTVWVFDFSTFLLVYIVFLGLALALQEGSHVAVDLFLEIVHGRVRQVLRVIGLLITVFYGGVLTWVVTRYALQAFQMNWKSASLIAVPLKYVYVVGPVGAFLFTLTAIGLTIESIMGEKGRG